LPYYDSPTLHHENSRNTVHLHNSVIKIVGLSHCGSLFWCNQVVIADFSLSLEMTGQVGNEGRYKNKNP
ncbi:MAG: hypothetical protein J5588_00315, partial [Bacteroidales bacterium]|nr:hypothetical protein [Bacteroidales bacterium]